VFETLAAINARPEVYSRVTTADLWTDPHISARMLACHLDPDTDVASYRLPFVERSVAWIRDRFALGPGRRVADFGCGPGLYTNRLARTGAAVTGIDLSTRSLHHARSTSHECAVPARYLPQDYLSYAEKVAYDLILMIMRDFGALPPEDRARLLNVVRAHLAPGGVLLFDVDSLTAFEAVQEKAVYGRDLDQGFFAPQPYFGFHNTYRYEPQLVSLDKYEIVVRDGARSYLIWIRYYSPETLAAELAGQGFEVVDVLGDVAGAGYAPGAPQFAAIAAPGAA
jgi:SAM-dependent methyltransferase